MHARGARIVLSVLILGIGARAGAQIRSFGVSGGLGLPMSGSGPREDVAYKDLYKSGISVAFQYRRLLKPHVSWVGEFGLSHQPINPETFAMLLNAGDLVIKGGDLSRERLSFGLAWESNTITGPNIVMKVLPSWYRTSPKAVTVTSPTQGVLQVNSLSTIADFGINFGVSMEKPIKPNLAIVAGGDFDMILGSDLFDPNLTTTLMHVTVKAGVVYWF